MQMIKNLQKNIQVLVFNTCFLFIILIYYINIYLVKTMINLQSILDNKELTEFLKQYIFDFPNYIKDSFYDIWNKLEVSKDGSYYYKNEWDAVYKEADSWDILLKDSIWDSVFCLYFNKEKDLDKVIIYTEIYRDWFLDQYVERELSVSTPEDLLVLFRVFGFMK